MDNRRLTISSEEQIGEALMRVSNTLEAERLTKSLEYQEKIRRRTAFRTVLSIILVLTLILLLVVGGLLLYVLWKYMDPILKRLLPFLEMVFRDFGTIWRSLVESSTYMPAFLDTSLKMMNEMLTTMQNMHGLPLKEMLYNVNNILATTNGLLAGMGNMMAGAGDALAVMGNDVHGLMVGTGDFMANMQAQITPIMQRVPPMMDSMQNGLDSLGATIENMKLPGGTIDQMRTNMGMLNEVTNKSLKSLLYIMDNTSTEDMVTVMQKSLTTLDNTLTTIDGINTAIDENSAGIPAMVANLSQSLESLASAMKKLDELIGNIHLPPILGG